MSEITQVLTRYSSRRWWISLPFIIALLVLGSILWAGFRVITYPHDGIGDIHPTGLIGELDADGPAAGLLQIDDKIIEIEGVPWEEAYYFYTGKRGGDPVSFLVERSNKNIPITISLIDPPVSEVLLRLVPLFVALIFWAVGVGVQTFKPSDSAADVFFAWCQISALTLAAGVGSYTGPLWSAIVFNIFLWIIGPLSVHLHLFFPQTAPKKWFNIQLPLLYTIAVFGSLPYLVWGYLAVRSSSWYSLYLSSGRIFLAVNLLIVVGLLVYNYRHPAYGGARGKIRIVALGGGLTAIPIVTLTILPDALFHQPLILYPLTFLVLGLLPITYGYAIFRLNLIEIEGHVNRGATFILVYSILGGFYLILYGTIQFFLPQIAALGPLINTILVLILASFFIPLRNRVQKFVDSVFYGGWYDYRSAVTEMTRNLEQYTELHLLAKEVSLRLVETFRLEETCVFLRDREGDFSVIELSSRTDLKESPESTYPVLPRTSLTYLLKIGAIERNSLRRALSEVTLTAEELQLLNSEQIHLWVPVVGHDKIQGLLALGPKLGGDIFSGEDMDILRILARQMSPVIENIHLVTQLRDHAADLEARVQARTVELHNAKERVEAILASVGEGVFVTNLDGHIITVNQAFERQTGFKAEELRDRNHRELLQRYNDPVLIESMQGTLNRGAVWSGELVNPRKDGGFYDIHLTIAPVRDQGGKILSYVGSQRDITRQKELDHLKDMFVSDVSHELRTPTANIHLYLELLENAPHNKQNKYLAVIKEQSLLLTKLVEDILDLSRLAMAKAKKIEFEKMDINLLTEQVISAHKPLVEDTGLKIEFSPCSDLPAVWGDGNQMSRVITNLVSNAVRYTTRGKICVETFKSDGDVCLTVRDTGIGIEKEDLPHIFERFYRGRNVRQSKIHGTGLGLAIVKEIVELHDGSLEVNSEYGIGSEFKVILPENHSG
jgi:PAS domain S-box-containing protein